MKSLLYVICFIKNTIKRSDAPLNFLPLHAFFWQKKTPSVKYYTSGLNKKNPIHLRNTDSCDGK